jgi:1,4-dihydroxy-2-naphthoate polyprenyltransferase
MASRTAFSHGQPGARGVFTDGALWAGLYRLADPKITLASMASLVVGAAVAARAAPLHLGWLFATAVALFFVETAKNASGEVFDFDSGDDIAIAPDEQTPFSGGKRVILDGLLTRGQTVAVAAVFYVLAGGAGLMITALREPLVLAVGLVGMAAAYFYHAPPLRLAYRGFGELAVGITYGPLIACGTALVQTGDLDLGALALSVPLGMLIAAFLVINELPDARADRSAGKRTLVVAWGRKRAVWLVRFLIVGAFSTLALVVALRAAPLGALVGLWAVHFGVMTIALLRAEQEAKDIVGAQVSALSCCLAYAAGVAAGLLWF